MALAALVTGAAAGLVARQRSEEALRQKILSHNLAFADAVAEMTWQMVDGFETGIDRLASRPDVIDAIEAGGTQDLTRELEEFAKLSTLGASASALDAGGTVLASSQPGEPPVGASEADREHFRQVLATGAPYFGQPFSDRATGAPVAQYAAPVFDPDGRLQGVITGRLSLAYLANFIGGVRRNLNARVEIVDRRGTTGTIVIHPDPARVLTAPSGNNRAVDRLLAGERGTTDVTNSEGEQDLASYAQVPHMPWGVIMLEPRAVAFAPLAVLNRGLTLLIAVLTLISAAAGVWLAARLVRPLARLQRVMASYAAGAFEARVPLLRHDELGVLGSAFNVMAGELQARDRQLQTVLEEQERTIDDRTEALVAANQAVHQEKATLDAVMGSMTEGVLVLDADGRICYFNERASRLLGRRASTAVGCTVPELFQRLGDRLVNVKAVLARWERAMLRPEELGLLEITLGLNHRRDLLLQVFPIASAERLAHWRGVLIRNVSAERELARTKDELLATISHELRTPLASLVGFVELLLEGGQSEDDRRLYLATMARDGQRLTELIDNFLDLQRMETERVQLALFEVNLRSVLSQVTLDGAGGNHQLVIDVDDDLPPVWGDEDGVRRLIGHLVSNAAKYSPGGEVIRLSARLAGAAVEVSVEDSGIGIDAEILPQLFTKFYRSDNSDRRQTQGAGLGLAICSHLAEALGGRIWAESAGVGQGSKFTFTLRRADVPVGAATE